MVDTLAEACLDRLGSEVTSESCTENSILCIRSCIVTQNISNGHQDTEHKGIYGPALVLVTQVGHLTQLSIGSTQLEPPLKMLG